MISQRCLVDVMGEFEDILQFGEENVPDALEIASQ